MYASDDLATATAIATAVHPGHRLFGHGPSVCDVLQPVANPHLATKVPMHNTPHMTHTGVMW